MSPVGASALGAQRIDVEPREVAALLREEGHSGFALQVLTQVDGPRQRHELDALADTLAAIAITAPADGGFGQRAGTAARHTLLLALTGGDGIPYDGAAERILAIVENAKDIGARAGALSGFLSMPDTVRMLQIFERVARSANPVAYVAVGFLARETGPGGVALLRDLYRQGAIMEPLARQEIDALAYHLGWTGGTRPR